MLMRSLGIAVVSLSALTACTGDPSFGERLRTQGQDTAAAGESWIEGQQMVERGEKLVKEGRKQVSSGEKKIDKGRDLIEDGRDMMAEAESGYTSAAAD